MRRITVRMPDEVFDALRQEHVEWQKVRGPRFSLNDFCVHKFWQRTPITTWSETFTTGTNTVTMLTSTAWLVPPKEKKNARKGKA